MRPPAFPLGIALFTVQRDARRDFPGTLARLAALGYREVDMYPTDAGGLDPAAARIALDAAGMTCVSSRVTLPVLHRGWERALDAAQALGARFVTLANINGEDRVDATDWTDLVALFARRGAEARARGLTFAYHNHAFELQRVPGLDLVPFDLIVARTEPRDVTLQVDVYWLANGGRDVVRELHRLGGARIGSLHLKDAAPGTGAITTVGAGTLDFRAILAAARDVGIRHAFFEQDGPADPFGAATAAAAHLQRLAPP